MFDKSKLKIKDFKVKLKFGICLAVTGVLISSPQNCLVGFGNFVLAVKAFLSCELVRGRGWQD